MATFKVGDRVRVVNISDPGKSPSPRDMLLLGREGVIVGLGPVETGLFSRWRRAYEVKLDGDAIAEYGFDAHHLAPLTDPKADAFVESLRECEYAVGRSE
jgi:hypothetical protein